MSYYSGCLDSHQPHFLEACFLCRKTLACNSDIFMYRGNTPFCSKECRQEQIEIDESTEKKSWKMSSSSSRSIRKSDPKDSTPNKCGGCGCNLETMSGKESCQTRHGFLLLVLGFMFIRVKKLRISTGWFVLHWNDHPPPLLLPFLLNFSRKSMNSETFWCSMFLCLVLLLLHYKYI
ncbi:hypothetical protein OIU78_015929 [Salix suchowensis]|nr:hypothetical protein OIU78_015929 [Salix suchowensis]